MSDKTTFDELANQNAQLVFDGLLTEGGKGLKSSVHYAMQRTAQWCAEQKRGSESRDEADKEILRGLAKQLGAGAGIRYDFIDKVIACVADSLGSTESSGTDRLRRALKSCTGACESVYTPRGKAKLREVREGSFNP